MRIHLYLDPRKRDGSPITFGGKGKREAETKVADVILTDVVGTFGCAGWALAQNERGTLRVLAPSGYSGTIFGPIRPNAGVFEDGSTRVEVQDRKDPQAQEQSALLVGAILDCYRKARAGQAGPFSFDWPTSQPSGNETA